MIESNQAQDRATIANLTAGRDRNLQLAELMDGSEALYRDGLVNPMAEELPGHLRRVAERLDQLIDYLR